MKLIRVLAIVALAPFVLVGCASSGGGAFSSWNKCMVGGAVAGAAAGVAVDGEIGGAAIGALTGMGLGSLLCIGDQDSDGDGVPDEMDECPATPAGVQVGANGCPLDSDGDGVPDYLDQCPGTPAGVAVDARGCPMDSDLDGVPDHLDKCPDTLAGTEVDANGCPLPGEKLAILVNINFDFDKSNIRSGEEAKLQGVLQTLVDNPDIKITVEGHTDSIGTDEYNMGLSQRRADSVRSYLLSRGIDFDRVDVAAFGERVPLASNDTREGRAMSRRVEFVVR